MFLLGIESYAIGFGISDEYKTIKISPLTNSSISVNLFVYSLKSTDTDKMDIKYATGCTIINNATSAPSM